MGPYTLSLGAIQQTYTYPWENVDAKLLSQIPARCQLVTCTTMDLNRGRTNPAQMNRLIPSEHVQIVCKLGQGHDCCRYLMLGPEGFECGKHGEFSKYFDQQVAGGKMVARGDNCDGVFEITPPKTTVDY